MESLAVSAYLSSLIVFQSTSTIEKMIALMSNQKHTSCNKSVVTLQQACYNRYHDMFARVHSVHKSAKISGVE